MHLYETIINPAIGRRVIVTWHGGLVEIYIDDWACTILIKNHSQRWRER